MENNEQHLLEDPLLKLVPASLGKRLANYLIDVIIFSFLLSFILVVASPVYPLMQKIMAKQPIDFMDQLMISFLYGLFMSVQEAVLRGKTIAKYITGTRAVDTNGLPVNSQTAFLRGLIRIVPFEQFTALTTPGRPWHDRWSKTMVLDESKSVFQKNERNN
ncbi:MAG: RDD family protein [Bacteroidota bacterium]